MPFPTDSYDYFVFDCDGVILNSNTVKSEAFYKTTQRFGEQLADDFVTYHQLHGGISRNEKFAYFIETMLGKALPENQSLLEQLLADYGSICQRDLLLCDLIPGVESFLQALPKGKAAYVITGGNQQEVRHTFKRRQLDTYFAAILGSPTSKHDNMASLQVAGKFNGKGVYFGDARLDMELAATFGQDFVFISGVSEWPDGLTLAHSLTVKDFTELNP
jgi:phosphoglycolate phosphatase-like HAD superfamily hydrolase